MPVYEPIPQLYNNISYEHLKFPLPGKLILVLTTSRVSSNMQIFVAVATYQLMLDFHHSAMFVHVYWMVLECDVHHCIQTKVLLQ